MGFHKRALTRGAAGFTMVELVVTMIILGISAVFLIGPMISTFRVVLLSSGTRELWDEGGAALKRMTMEIKEAEQVTIEGESEIRVVKSHPAADGFQEVVFYLDGSVLYRRGEPDGDDAVLARNVSSFTATYDEDGSGVVTLELEMVGDSGEDFQLSADVHPMNLTGAASKSFYNDDEESGDWELVIEGS